jgi:hypothetical protein
MIDERTRKEIEEITMSPFYQIILRRLQVLVDNADSKLHSSTRETFEYNKGQYDMAKRILEIMRSAKSIADDGIVQMRLNEA